MPFLVHLSDQHDPGFFMTVLSGSLPHRGNDSTLVEFNSAECLMDQLLVFCASSRPQVLAMMVSGDEELRFLGSGG